MFTSWLHCLKRAPGGDGRAHHHGRRRRTVTPRRSFVPRLLVLEDRTLPSTFTVMNLADSGDGSLRQAIFNAELSATPGPHDIVFAHGLHGTITLTSGELDITTDLTIHGPGDNRLTVSGDNLSRVFDISPGTTVTIADLTITDGLADGSTPDHPTYGGGILNQGDLALAGVVVSDNTASGKGPLVPGDHLGGGAGGGVANFGTLTITGSLFTANRALGVNDIQGAFFTRTGTINFPGIGIGGGLWNGSGTTATVTDSRFTDNLAQGGSDCSGTFAGLGQGGAIYSDATLTVIGSSFLYNRAVGGNNNINSDLYSGYGVGGAIASGNHTIAGGPSAVLTVSQSAFSFNQAVGGDKNRVTLPPNLAYAPSNGLGGGIFVFQGEATIRQSVLADNRAKGGAGGGDQQGSRGDGGGIFFINFLGKVTGIVEGCALVQNEAIGGPGTTDHPLGGDALGGGLAAGTFGTSSFSGSVTVSNTLVAGNLARGGDGGMGGNGGDGLGGGVFNDSGSTMTVTASSITHNEARGGKGKHGGSDGQGIGGGVYNNLGGTFMVDALTRIRHNHASTSDDDCFNC